MSIQRIRHYQIEVRNEQTIRTAFQALLNEYARQQQLELVAEVVYRPKNHPTIIPDGTLIDALQQPRGYWESKDEYDDLDYEIQSKFAKHYPTTNILFEDGRTAILYQRSREVGRVAFSDEQALDTLLTTFVSYESQEQRAFLEALDRFHTEVPDLAATLRDIIRTHYATNHTFKQQAHDFLTLAREAINPAVELADVREMLIQHILTQDIFNVIFDEVWFHQENAIAKALGAVVNTFFQGQVRRTIVARMRPYYEAINARAAQIHNHHEKQKFLKILYETFYKAYNPKGADRLGIVYTPNEIVRFMIESADTLLWRHFGKGIGDAGVNILDPATGTGTFITELIEYLPPAQLEHKYRHELHCNEVAILPYYIANLNIEYTYQQRTGEYVPFENIVFVDTLDNMGFANGSIPQPMLPNFGLVDANAVRIKQQNQQVITLVIGNPPYNANQLNENQNNRNREYPQIDQRIKATYVKHSTAQKTKLYDMYTRFYRWASDRLGEDGIIAFVTNRSFLDARTFDGFRKVVADEFAYIYIIDLGGDVRKNPKLSGPKHNVFAIQTGVAIAFMVRRAGANDQPCQIWYARRPEMEAAKGKLRFLAMAKWEQIEKRRIQPNKRYYWLQTVENDWENLLPVVSRDFKMGKKDVEKPIFGLYSLGNTTNRDDWVYDFSPEALERKIRFFMDVYEDERKRWRRSAQTEAVNNFVDRTIKWTVELEGYLTNNTPLEFDKKHIRLAARRPFVKKYIYYDRILIHRMYQQANFFAIGEQDSNLLICVNRGNKPFNVLVANNPPDLHYNGDSQCLPLYCYDELGQRVDNITDWALAQFREHYASRDSIFAKDGISKSDIFHYVYAVLHHPAYREKYKLNLKRDFPRIPFYADFWQWATWGEQLLRLHLHYETVDPYPLHRHDKDPATVRKAYKATLKADTHQGLIRLDTLTTLDGVPAEAWAYRLGNRSALEWVLDRYKPRKPRDPTIREKFNTYDFRDHKEAVIDLLCRVTMVSVETMATVNAMP